MLNNNSKTKSREKIDIELILNGNKIDVSHKRKVLSNVAVETETIGTKTLVIKICLLNIP